jgi:hypothetical protein
MQGPRAALLIRRVRYAAYFSGWRVVNFSPDGKCRPPGDIWSDQAELAKMLPCHRLVYGILPLIDDDRIAALIDALQIERVLGIEVRSLRGSRNAGVPWW